MPAPEQSHLSEVPLPELIERAKRVRDNSTLMHERGVLLTEFRLRGMSWRQIQAETGWPVSNARRWLKKYEASSLSPG